MNILNEKLQGAALIIVALLIAYFVPYGVVRVLCGLAAVWGFFMLIAVPADPNINKRDDDWVD